MKLDRVTLTGADNSVEPHELLEISETFPFVEWGILVSRSSSFNGRPRFPSVQWVKCLMGDLSDRTLGTRFGPKFQFSCHICGAWVRDIFSESKRAAAMIQDEWPWLLPRCSSGVVDTLFQRVQLNTHGQKGHKQPVKDILDGIGIGRQVIFQFDGVNDGLFDAAASGGINHFTEERLDVAPLFDMSGGAGIVPKEWPVPFEKHMRHPNVDYFGYAGGLGPNNLEAELHRIAQAAGDHRVWIDMETLIRSDDDELFDLDKCVAVLELVRDKGLVDVTCGRSSR